MISILSITKTKKKRKNPCEIFCGRARHTGNLSHQNVNIITDAWELYARRKTKKKDIEVDTLSELVKSIAYDLKRRFRRLQHSVITRHDSIFCDPEVFRELSRLQENFVIVPANKASNM